MRKPVTYVNIALLIAAMWLAADTRSGWRGNNARYSQFAAPVPAVSPAAVPTAGANPAGAMSYAEVADRNLFAQDRNNNQPSVEKKPAPPLPLAIGTLNLGSGMIALMADQKMAAEHSFRRVKEGDEIGGWRVAEIAEHKVVVDFEGERKTIDVYESAASAVAAAPAYTPPAASAGPRVFNATQPATAATPPAGASAGAAASSAPGTALPQDPNDPFKTCVVEGNRIKCTRRTAFGAQIWYEQLK